MMPSEMENYLFDLRGYLVLERAVSAEQVGRINAAIDTIPPLKDGEWHGNVQGHSYHGEIDGRNLQNIVEGGPEFEELIDHPSWIDYVRTYVGRKEGLFIDECFASIRRTGGFFPVHSGGYRGALRGAFHYKDGVFRCGHSSTKQLRAAADLPT